MRHDNYKQYVSWTENLGNTENINDTESSHIKLRTVNIALFIQHTDFYSALYLIFSFTVKSFGLTSFLMAMRYSD